MPQERIFTSHPIQSVEIDKERLKKELIAAHGERKKLYIAGAIAGFAFPLIPLLFYFFYGVFIVVLEKLMQTNPWEVSRLINERSMQLLAYLLATWPYMILSIPAGVIMAELRRRSGASPKLRALQFDTKRRFKFRVALDSIFGIVATPIVIVLVSLVMGTYEDVAPAMGFVIFSGIGFYAVWIAIDNLILSRAVEPDDKLRLEWELHEMFRRDRMFNGCSIDVEFKPETGELFLRGSVDSRESQEAARQIALNQVGVQRVVMDELAVEGQTHKK